MAWTALLTVNSGQSNRWRRDRPGTSAGARSQLPSRSPSEEGISNSVAVDPAVRRSVPSQERRARPSVARRDFCWPGHKPPPVISLSIATRWCLGIVKHNVQIAMQELAVLFEINRH